MATSGEREVGKGNIGLGGNRVIRICKIMCMKLEIFKTLKNFKNLSLNNDGGPKMAEE